MVFFPYENVGIVSVPLGFQAAIIATLLTEEPAAEALTSATVYSTASPHLEARRNVTAKVPKVPNVCHAFGVGCIDLPSMLTRLKFKFG